MSYMALYRKFRPGNFEDVKGQEHIVTTLKNQIKANRIGHAYLFCGTRGTGKTTIAKIFAKAVNCENPQDGSPCGECEICKKIASQTIMNVIEIDAASNNGVDNIREIVEEVSYSPTEGKYKVYIIDEVHMLSTGAFNALLKTLEEPPSYVIFILATTEPHKIPVTIHSRCQRYDFKRISMDTISNRILELTEKENVQIEDAAVRYIAKVADGSMRDALSLLDQCIAFHYGEVLTYAKTLDVLGAVDNSVFSMLMEAIMKDDILSAIGVLDDVVSQGRELKQFVTDFIWYMRNLMLVKSGDISSEMLEVSKDTLERLKEEAKDIKLSTIMRDIRIFSELSNQIRFASQKRVLIEMAIIKACRPQMEENNEALLERVIRLEHKLQNGFVPAFTGEGGNIGNLAPVRKKVELPKAVSEEIMTISKNWSSLIDALDQPMKSYLENFKLSVGEGNTLLLVTGKFYAKDYFDKEENLKVLKQYLEDYLQKEIQIEVRFLEEGEEFSDIYPSLERLGMDVQIEEE